MKQPNIHKNNSIGIRLALVVAVFWGGILFGALEAQAAIYYVKHDAGGSNNGSSWANAFTLLESALDAVSSGDEIWVAAGTYYPTEDDYGLGGGDRGYHFEMKNGVGIYGGFAGTETLRTQRNWQTNLTILSGDIGTQGDAGDNCYHVFYNYSIDNTGVLDGFTITGGYADGDSYGSEYLQGGGIHNTYCTATISNCVIKGNHAATSDAEGGGMYNYDDGPTITNCVFEDNSSDYYGGGMCNSGSSPTVTGCRFVNNSALTDGGGMLSWDESNPIITNCEFIGNSTGVDGYGGGGMYIYDGSNAQITNCKFIGNDAGGDGDGGGISLDEVTSDTVITNCLFIGNSARNGGGMDIGYGTAQLINCTFSGNSANYGGGIHFFYLDATTITNTIVWGNSAAVEGNEINIADFNPSNPTFSYCDIAGSGGSAGWNTAMGNDGGGNIDADPLFADAANDALQLLSGSPCINTGDNSAVPAGITIDLDENARIVDGTVDMGAYEYFLAAPAAAIPTLTEWGMLILFSGLGIGAAWTLRKDRSRNAAI